MGKGEAVSFPKALKKMIKTFRNSQKAPNHKNTAEKGKVTKSHETPMDHDP